MKKSIIIACGVAATLSFALQSNNKPSWSYSGQNGSANWAQLSADFSACSGQNQSPVNLTGFIEADLTPIAFDYTAGGKEILNTGHTAQVIYNSGSSITVGGNSYNLVQYHFHAPSENHINGKSYPLEAHFVNADSEGNLAVVAVMFEEGEENPDLAKVWQKLPTIAGMRSTYSDPINAADLLPVNKDYYRFTGSLTTPPCSEGVNWLVMKDSVSASKEQLEKFASILSEPNNRPIQAINARTVLK